MRHQRREYDDAPLAHRNGERIRTVLFTAHVTELRQSMRQRPAQMSARNHPGTTVVDGRVVESDPAGQVRLRLDVGVAVVLMPRERLWILGLFVHGLIPVKAHVGADEIVAEILKDAARRELAQDFGKLNQVNGESDSVGLCDAHPAVGTRAKELLSLRLERIDRIANAHDGRRIDRIFKHEEAALVERSRLLVGDQSKRPAHGRPTESMIQRMECSDRFVSR